MSEVREEVQSLPIASEWAWTAGRRDTRLLIALPILLILGINLALAYNFWIWTIDFFTWVKWAYAFNTLLMPLLLLPVSARLFLLSRSQPDRLLAPAGVLFLLGAGMLFGLRVYATHIEPYDLQVRSIVIESPKITRPVRLLHISDIQSDAVEDYEAKVFERIRALKPDLLIHTGDLLQPILPATEASEIPKMAALFETLSCPLGIFGVQGDADDFTKDVPPEQMGGDHVLQNRSVVITGDGFRINILGLTLGQSAGGALAAMDQEATNDPEAVENWLRKTDPGDFTLLLGHRPDFVMWHQDQSIDLCLAGHTHGGQIVIPGYGPITTASNIPREWARGFRAVGRTRLNVSAGIGCEHARDLPNIRLFCPPEMTLFELRPEGESAG